MKSGWSPPSLDLTATAFHRDRRKSFIGVRIIKVGAAVGFGVLVLPFLFAAACWVEDAWPWEMR